ncbi:MAG: hypothetical protein ABIF85_05780 [Nanoarchaeota archaeon]|nr:hypothetical protein [Nanoarchaeota archaeon]MBU4299876.1 hypothetical protein [Nanoarchaeota archaeon]MBU4451701.1 hypothetical protein [Nanoarchaeota archaeon]MCG2723643.1 hypothetical protein [archaeon]
MIKFNSFKEKTVLNNPLNNFAEEMQTIEYRQDPLVGRWSRININRAKRTHQAQNKGDSGEAVPKSCDTCFFCKANVERKTPEFPKKLKIGKRLKSGGAIIFPNLFPFAKYHAVCTLSENHGAGLNEITAKNLEDALTASIKYIKAVYASDKKVKHASINMNFMPPAAASIIHPHLQIVCDSKPSTYEEQSYLKSKKYFKKTGKNYFEELAKTDKIRLVKSNKNAVWLAAFSPVLANEVIGTFLKKTTVMDLSESDIKTVAKEISGILNALYALGARSANMSLFGAPLDEKSKHYTLHARIGMRPEMRANYSTDKGFMEIFHEEAVISTIPEEVAANMKGELNRKET